MVSSLRLDVDARRRKVDEILATVRGSAVFCWDFSLQRWMAQTGTEDLKLVHSKLWQVFFLAKWIETSNLSGGSRLEFCGL